MKIYNLLFLLPILLVSFVSQNEFKVVSDSEGLLKELKKVADQTSTISSSYSEEKFISVLSNSQTTTGKFYYKNSDKMRWEQTDPFEYIILISGESLRIIENGKEKQISQSNKVAAKVNAFMMSLIQGNYQNSEQLDARCLESSNQYLIELTPTIKPLNKVYSKMNLYFSKLDYRLESIEFLEVGGDRKIVTFFDQVYNEKIEDQIFTTL